MASYNVSGDVLNEEDLAEILHILGTSVTKWREIGVVLGLEENVLNRIEHENRDLMSCLRKMVSEWLNKNYNTERFGEPTWEKLVAAVKSKVGGNNSALAQEIARKHGIHLHIEEFGARRADHPTASCWFCCFRTTTSSNSSRAELPKNSHTTTPESLTTSIDTSQQLLQAIPMWKVKDIKDQPSYHGALTGNQAELKLRKCGGNCYLLRYSEKHKAFVLSVLARNDDEDEEELDEAFHANFTLKITKKDDGKKIYEIEGSEAHFESIYELLECYSTTPLSPTVASIGKPCIKRNPNRHGITV